MDAAPHSEGLLRESFALARRAFPAFLRVQGPVVLAGAVVTVWTDLAETPLMWKLVLGIPLGILGAVLSAPFVVTVTGTLDGQAPRLKQAWARARPRLWNFIVTGAIAGLGAALALGLAFGSLAGVAVVIVKAARIQDPLTTALVVAIATTPSILVAAAFSARWATVAPVSLFEKHSPARNLAVSRDRTRRPRKRIRRAFVLTLIPSVVLTTVFVVFNVARYFHAGTPLHVPGNVRAAEAVVNFAIDVPVGLIVLSMQVILYRKLPALEGQPLTLPKP